MLLPFENLNRQSVQVSNINLLFQSPAYRHIPMSERLINGFLYITRGECTYTCSHGEKLHLLPDSVIYLPFGCLRALDIAEDGMDFYRVDFDLSINGDLAFFSEDPLLLSDNANAGFRDCIASLAEECKYENNNLAKAQWLLGCFAALLPHPSSIYHSRLGPAIRYIDEHFTEPLNGPKLAALCFLGSAQFYNLFREQFGKTPLEYRNGLLLRRAKLLLEAGENSVAAVADTLGFTSAAYFSRFFKLHTGNSPTEYIVHHRLQNTLSFPNKNRDRI